MVSRIFERNVSGLNMVDYYKGRAIDTCSLFAYRQEGYNWQNCGSHTGQDLEAIEYESEQYRLHLWTLNGPMLVARRNQGDRIPESLGSDSDFSNE